MLEQNIFVANSPCDLKQNYFQTRNISNTEAKKKKKTRKKKYVCLQRRIENIRYGDNTWNEITKH